MDIEFSAEDRAFQAEVRQFIEDNYPQHLREIGSREDMGRDEFLEWHKILHKQGWVAPSWPVEYGGTGWTATQKYIWSEEAARAETIPILPFGVGMVGPVIYTFGNAEQKARFLPRILSGEDFWCQGYSEPGSGSDLASLKTKAVRDGDKYIINGQKTWTTLAQHADWIFVLARTDPSAAKPQEGISFFLVDMKTPGVEVRPIITIGGHHEVNETWLTDVEVPAENLIGEENKGWTYAKYLLAHERTGIAGVARSKRALERIRQLAVAEKSGGKPLLTDPAFARRVSELEIDLTALEYTELRSLADEEARPGAGLEKASMLKIKGTEIQQRLTELALEAAGPYAAPFSRGMEGENLFPVGPDYAHEAAPTYFNTRKTSIYGGSNEIQRNIIAKLILGL